MRKQLATAIALLSILSAAPAGAVTEYRPAREGGSGPIHIKTKPPKPVRSAQEIPPGCRKVEGTDAVECIDRPQRPPTRIASLKYGPGF